MPKTRTRTDRFQYRCQSAFIAHVLLALVILVGFAPPAFPQSVVQPLGAVGTGATIDLQFTGAVHCPGGCLGLSITVNGLSRSLGGVTGAGSSTLHILLGQSLAPGDAVTLSYAPGTITDSTGNPIAAFTTSVTNNTNWSTVQLVSAIGIGATIDLQFTDTVLCPGGCLGLSVTVNGSSRSLGGITGAGSPTPHILLGQSLAPGDVVTLSYAPGTITDSTGNPIAAFTTSVTNSTNWSTVQIVSAIGIGATIDLQFTNTVLCPGGCLGLSVTVNGLSRSLGGITGAGSPTPHILLGQSLAPGDVVTLSYAPGTITDSTGNPIAPFSITVTNRTASPTVQIVSAIGIGATIDLQFTDTVLCPGGCLGLSVTVNGLNRSLGGVTGAGSPTPHILLGQSLAPGDVVTLSYTPGTITDSAGNPISAFTTSVTNNTNWSTVQVVSAIGIGATIDLQFTDTVLCPGGCLGLSVTVNGLSRSLGGVTGAGSPTPHILLGQSLAPGDVVTLSYAPGTITDSTGNPIAAFTKSVTNTTAGPAQDVTATVSIKQGSIRLNRSSGRYLQTLTVRNISDTVVVGPLSLVFDGLSTSSIASQLAGVTFCTTPSGSPFINLNVGEDGLLSRKEQIRVDVEFAVTSSSEISYDNRLLSGLGCR